MDAKENRKLLHQSESLIFKNSELMKYVMALFTSRRVSKESIVTDRPFLHRFPAAGEKVKSRKVTSDRTPSGATGERRSRGLGAEAIEAFGPSDGVDGVGELQDAVGWGGQGGEVGDHASSLCSFNLRILLP